MTPMWYTYIYKILKKLKKQLIDLQNDSQEKFLSHCIFFQILQMYGSFKRWLPGTCWHHRWPFQKILLQSTWMGLWWVCCKLLGGRVNQLFQRVGVLNMARRAGGKCSSAMIQNWAGQSQQEKLSILS